MVPLPAIMRRLPPLSFQPMVTLPSNGELLSLDSTQSPYQRWVPSLLANEPFSKLSRTLAAACVVIGALGVICLTPRTESTLACCASVSFASTASMTPVSYTHLTLPTSD